MNQNPILIPVDFPEPDFKISDVLGKQMIWDAIRKKNLVLTPEEWVRQNFIRYLTTVLKYPASLMAIEKEIRLVSLKKRCDIVIYKNSLPWMIVECKEPEIQLTEKVLRQILNYNMTLKVPFLVLTNGNQTFAIKRTDREWKYVDSLPAWE